MRQDDGGEGQTNHSAQVEAANMINLIIVGIIAGMIMGVAALVVVDVLGDKID